MNCFMLEWIFLFLFSPDPIFIDFGRIPHWNCPVEGETEETHPDVYSESKKMPSVDRADDLDSEPSINTRRKYKGEYQFPPCLFPRWNPGCYIVNCNN